ncbi:MAG TPA: GAF domain-containing SpoIIE family protein phosphatase [Candidatus Aquilonibacter sp.]|nr:GAF domain-containing SpoIIE family protein phosphatase [Candidatus Aquilonibacter sp.]
MVLGTGTVGQPDAQRRHLRLLLRVGELLSESLDYEATLQSVCAAVVEEFADICLLDIGIPQALDLAAGAHRDANKTPHLRVAGEFLTTAGRSARHPVWLVTTTGKPLAVPRVSDEYLREYSTSDAHEAFMREMRYRSLLIVPLISTTQGTLGALTLVRTSEGDPFDGEALEFAMDLGRRCATAIGKAMLFEQTQRIATLFQRAALPSALPCVSGLTFDAFYEPSSEHLLVGGDWYDAFLLPDRRVAVTVGDVLGHGIEAAVWMSRLRNSLRATLYTDPDPARALVITDHLMRLESDDTFTTALVAIVDPVHQTLSCASAGHPGPMLFEPDGRVSDRFIERGLPLGLRHLGDGSKAAQTVTLRPGSFAVFFTDGLLEWDRNIASAWEAMREAIMRREVREAPNPALMIRDAVLGEHRHQDDVAILTLRIDELLRREIRP